MNSQDYMKKVGSRSANMCIECDVLSCANHNKAENYCSLQSIKVGTHESDPKVEACTDCESFRPDSCC